METLKRERKEKTLVDKLNKHKNKNKSSKRDTQNKGEEKKKKIKKIIDNEKDLNKKEELKIKSKERRMKIKYLTERFGGMVDLKTKKYKIIDPLTGEVLDEYIKKVLIEAKNENKMELL